MKKDIILCGVGGQGILSIATIIGEAATEAGINLKQAEVHGMSQRGGDVQSNLRLSTENIYSDLIPQGGADVVISMEPMESLRYLPYLAKTGTIVTSSKPFINIPNYPDEAALQAELDALPSVVKLDITKGTNKMLKQLKAHNYIIRARVMVSPMIGAILTLGFGGSAEA